MAYREISVLQIREILRRWMAGESMHSIRRNTGVDRRTIRRYIDAAEMEGLAQKGDAAALSDVLVAAVKKRCRAGNPRPEMGAARRACATHREFIQELVDEGVKVTKIRILLGRDRGVEVPYRTLARFVKDELRPAPSPTVRLDDPPPGQEVQVDFGLMGRVEWGGRRQKLWALVFTAVCSRHTFVWLTFRQTTEAFIAGCEAAWQFFGGVFAVMVMDNAKALVVEANDVAPRLNDAFLAYAQHRAFTLDTARVRRPQDKARVERTVRYVRESFFAGEQFVSIEQAQRAAARWCRDVAGRRVHGTTKRRPAQVFAAEELPRLLPMPLDEYDPPRFSRPIVQRDGHVTVAKALYSVPPGLVGQRVDARATRELVVLTHEGRPLRSHPRQPPGGRSTHSDDIPIEKRVYAQRDVGHLRTMAVAAGEHAAAYFDRVLDNPRPMSRMRRLYRFVGLINRYGGAPVDKACRQALALDVIDVFRIARMLEQALDTRPPPDEPPPVAPVLRPRFARQIDHFAVRRGDDDE